GGGQRLDVDLTRDLLQHAALRDAGGLGAAVELDDGGGLDRLGEVDPQEVDVQQVAGDRVALLLLHHDGRGAAVQLEVDHRAAVRERVAQFAGVDLEGHCVP